MKQFYRIYTKDLKSNLSKSYEGSVLAENKEDVEKYIKEVFLGKEYSIEEEIYPCSVTRVFRFLKDLTCYYGYRITTMPNLKGNPGYDLMM